MTETLEPWPTGGVGSALSGLGFIADRVPRALPWAIELRPGWDFADGTASLSAYHRTHRAGFDAERAAEAHEFTHLAKATTDGFR